MILTAIKMLLGDRAKYGGLLFGIAFTSFLVTFAAAYFGGMMTRSFALIAENPAADIWVMDPAVSAVDRPINLPDAALARVRGVSGVAFALPLAIAHVDVRFSNGQFQPFEIIGVDDATLSGVPPLPAGISASVLRAPSSVIIDAGGSSGKLDIAAAPGGQWQLGAPRLDAPVRQLGAGDEILFNDTLARVAGQSDGLPRFPPRPIMFTTYSNVAQMLPPERRRLTYVLAAALPGVDPGVLAARIASVTGLKARTAADFKSDSVRWMVANSEDVGDAITMLSIAMIVGFGVTGVMMFMFTQENLKHYAVLGAMGATTGVLLRMVCSQAALVTFVGTGIGLGACAAAGRIFIHYGFPYRLLWFAPALGGVTVALVGVGAALISMLPILKMRPLSFLGGR